jgi:hypothetical protein
VTKTWKEELMAPFEWMEQISSRSDAKSPKFCQESPPPPSSIKPELSVPCL